ncbi:hypothetical protein ABWED_0811 [Acinetobacter lwoffii]|nr:hypothetical protein ABEKA_1648 [Acinetobacter lwoffii]QZM11373.1 hypothetical protein ABVS_0643 [Acinetobacter lwoffii]UVB00116.1 hypothetical protein ABWED_0811 [Acinetobacter lwoffii]
MIAYVYQSVGIIAKDKINFKYNKLNYKYIVLNNKPYSS